MGTVNTKNTFQEKQNRTNQTYVLLNLWRLEVNLLQNVGCGIAVWTGVTYHRSDNNWCTLNRQGSRTPVTSVGNGFTLFGREFRGLLRAPATTEMSIPEDFVSNGTCCLRPKWLDGFYTAWKREVCALANDTRDIVYILKNRSGPRTLAGQAPLTRRLGWYV